MSLDPHIKLKALPLQYVELDAGVICKRGSTELRISGKGAPEVLPVILRATSGAGATTQEILLSFSEKDRAAVKKLIEKLTTSRMLVPISIGQDESRREENHLDIFYWHFGQSSDHII